MTIIEIDGERFDPTDIPSFPDDAPLDFDRDMAYRDGYHDALKATRANSQTVAPERPGSPYLEGWRDAVAAVESDGLPECDGEAAMTAMMQKYSPGYTEWFNNHHPIARAIEARFRNTTPGMEA